jgi:hypothetical protein
LPLFVVPLINSAKIVIGVLQLPLKNRNFVKKSKDQLYLSESPLGTIDEGYETCIVIFCKQLANAVEYL